MKFGIPNIALSRFLLFFCIECASTQAYYDLRHMQQIVRSENTFKDIPKKIEFIATNPKQQVNQFISDVQNLADKGNLTVQYKIKVEVDKVAKTPIKKTYKKFKSMKYNVPLKKKSMRLSSFELLMRKLADNNRQNIAANPVMTTDGTFTRDISTTSRIPILKYKPIINKVRPRYAKKPIKAVKTNEIILTRKN